MKKCRLCGERKKLKRSHIIPEFMYSSMYDEEHNFFVLSSNSKNGIYRKQKGDWEWLLCGDCETQLSLYERYVSLVLNGGTELQLEHDRNYIKIGLLDYQKFKLFQLSIIWRASISSRPIFNNVKLGKHEEIIRKMIFNEAPGREYEYGCILRMIFYKQKFISSFLIPPEKTRVAGDVLYQFAFNGFWWHFHVASHKANKVTQELFLKEDGSLLIAKTKLEGSQYVRDLAVQLFENKKNIL